MKEKQGSENFLKLVSEQTHAIRWLEKITVNLLREQLLPNSQQQSSRVDSLEFSELSSPMLNQLYKTIIEASKVLKLLPQANATFVLEKLCISLHDIVSR